MNYQEFRKTFFDLGCFTPNQVYSWQPGFDKNNLLNWVKKGLLLKLRNGMFLLGQTSPDYKLLTSRFGIHNLQELKSALSKLLTKVNLSQKARDFEHLLFEKRNSERILGFKEFVSAL
jgi:hypothetical protein